MTTNPSAEIDRILDGFQGYMTAKLIGGHQILPHYSKHEAKLQLLELINEARKDELKLINARFTTVRDDPKHAKMIEGYMLARDEFSRVKCERIAELSSTNGEANKESE